MGLSQVTIACPHCRREYDISIDLAKLARITSRASCARCKKVFEVTPERIQTRSARTTDHRREQPLVSRVPSSDVSRKRPVRRVDDDRRDIRRPDDRDAIRRSPEDDRRDAARDSVREAVRIEDHGVDSRTHSRDFRRTESRTISRDFRRTEIVESRADSRELRRTAEDARRDTVDLAPSDILDAEVPVARTRSVQRSERAPEIRVPAVVPPVAAPPPPDDDDADMAWLVQADPGLAGLTLEQSEGAVALEWLLTQAVGARREISAPNK